MISWALRLVEARNVRSVVDYAHDAMSAISGRFLWQGVVYTHSISHSAWTSKFRI